MAKKKEKIPWQKGIVASREGEPSRPARAADADQFIDLAMAEKDPERAKQHMLSAKVARVLGGINEQMVRMPAGRPKGSTQEHKDADALAYMESVSAKTGEVQPYKLARLAVEAGFVSDPMTAKKSQIDRLAGRWKQYIQKNKR